MARAPNFDLAGALASPSFTPAQKDAPALVELVVGGADPAATRAEQALVRLGATGRAAVDARLAGGGPVGGDTAELGDAATARLVGVLGMFARAGDETALAAVIERVRDPHVRVRRAAINALGKLPAPGQPEPLLARWDMPDVTPDERRSLVEALGKTGGDRAYARLSALDAGDDRELARLKGRALLMIERTRSRAKPSRVRADANLPHPLAVIARCKRGLEPLLVEELGSRGLRARAEGDGVLVQGLARWQDLFASRLWTSAAIRVPLADDGPSSDGPSNDMIEQTLAGPVVKDTLTALTEGEIRYRISFDKGKHRARVWQLAQKLPYVNDPTDSTWHVLVDDDHLELVPRKLDDPRFAWRTAEVPAASHPTVAAALAYVAGAKPDDRVWDPFVGSGAELVERARLGPYASLVGSDLDDTALAAARTNIDAAGLSARLERADARSFDPGGIDLILTNPPLGSRVQLDAVALLVDALPHFARVLALTGRLVWITPATKKTSPVAERLGLRRTRQLAVDLGGVRGHLERWERPA